MPDVFTVFLNKDDDDDDEVTVPPPQPPPPPAPPHTHAHKLWEISTITIIAFMHFTHAVRTKHVCT